LTHVVIAEKFGQQFGMRISKQTISGWIKDKDKYLKIEEEEVVDCYRTRNAKFPELEESIALWCKCMDSNIPVKIKASDYYGPLCNHCKCFRY
jgi:hypothetical protein